MGNVDIVRGAYESFAAGDVPAVMAALDEEVEWTEAAGFAYAGTYVGPQAVLDGVIMRLATEWDGVSVTPDELVGDGDTVVSIGWYGGPFRETGKQVHARFAHVSTFADERIVRFEQIVDSVKANEAMT